MNSDSVELQAGQVICRALGYGAMWGTVLGVAPVSPFVLGGLVVGEPAAVVFLPFAAVIGAAIGTFLGLIGGVAVLVARPWLRERSGWMRVLAGGAPAACVFLLRAVCIAGTAAIVILVMTSIVFATGSALGHRVAYGRGRVIRELPAREPYGRAV